MSTPEKSVVEHNGPDPVQPVVGGHGELHASASPIPDSTTGEAIADHQARRQPAAREPGPLAGAHEQQQKAGAAHSHAEVRVASESFGVGGVRILIGDCRKLLPTLPAESVQCCVTSPPYFGLRDYGVSGQIGLEPSPAEYVAEIVAVFREVRRVLKSDGTLWLNLGDSYANDGKWGGHTGGKHVKPLHCSPIGRNKRYTGLKPKDLIGIPWMVAFALREDGWFLRRDIIWHKPSVMPESVTDRPTTAHEYIFLLSKSERYHYDHEAIKEPSEYPNDDRKGRSYDHHKSAPTDERNGVRPGNYLDSGRPAYAMRNKRSVWSVTNAGYRDAHFATYPPDLVKPCVLAGCPVGGTVLDPFGGSGTTGMVALELGRSAVLIELNAEYVKLIEQRTNITPGFGFAGGGGGLETVVARERRLTR